MNQQIRFKRSKKQAMNTYYDPLTNRTLLKRPPAIVLDEVFKPHEFNDLKTRLEVMQEENVIPYEHGLGRYGLNATSDIESPLSEYHQLALERARSIFTPTLQPTYCLWVNYHGFRARLPRHVDDNACTYTIDLCISYKTQWPIYIENEEFLLEPNQAACYYGEDQYHWRGNFPDPAHNQVQMIFFHFAEPDHWYFTKGQSHVQNVIRVRHEYQKKNRIQSI